MTYDLLLEGGRSSLPPGGKVVVVASDGKLRGTVRSMTDAGAASVVSCSRGHMRLQSLDWIRNALP